MSGLTFSRGDSKQGFFYKIIKSLNFFENLEEWDLSWGEPFLAVSQDRRVWVRVFYEESLPVSPEKLQCEAERLKPHIPARGELLFCFPQSWKIEPKDLGRQMPFTLRLWSYSGACETAVFSREIRKEEKRPVQVLAPEEGGQADLVERLSPEEVHELAEMGVAFKRYALRAS